MRKHKFAQISRKALREYSEHYHNERNHQGLDNAIPFPGEGVGTLAGEITSGKMFRISFAGGGGLGSPHDGPVAVSARHSPVAVADIEALVGQDQPQRRCGDATVHAEGRSGQHSTDAA